MWFQRRNKGTAESKRALEEAKENLYKVRRRGSEVNKISNALKEIRERNHFAEELEAIIVRPRRTT